MTPPARLYTQEFAGTRIARLQPKCLAAGVQFEADRERVACESYYQRTLAALNEILLHGTAEACAHRVSAKRNFVIGETANGNRLPDRTACCAADKRCNSGWEAVQAMHRPGEFLNFYSERIGVRHNASISSRKAITVPLYRE